MGVTREDLGALTTVRARQLWIWWRRFIWKKLLLLTAWLSERWDGWDTAHAVPVGSGSCMLELQPANQPDQRWVIVI